MVFNTYHSRLKRRLAVATLALAVVGYFAFHAFNGDHGIIANHRFEARVVELQGELDLLKKDRVVLERRIALLKPESLDPDMLEERAMDSLNMAHPRDVLIMKR
ncbi:MAG: septum formation initiator family protein [Pseudomonadota bacterium]